MPKKKNTLVKIAFYSQIRKSATSNGPSEPAELELSPVPIDPEFAFKTEGFRK